MAERNSPRRLDDIFMNNCKIANELRKYRDLAGCVNQVALSGERGRPPADCADYAEYVISENLTYLDMVVANAAYTLMASGLAREGFQADAIARVMAGNMERRITGKKREELEACLQRLSRVQLYILADHDHQVGPDLYEGAFLPVEWESAGGKLRFRFLPGKQMPLYQYAEHHRQLIEVPFHRLRDDVGDNQIRHNNNDRMLLLRHYLLQELEILLYQGNKVEEQQIRLLKRDREGRALGLLWILGIVEDGEEEQGREQTAVAQKVQKALRQLMENWQQSGYLDNLQYQMLTPEEGLGVRIFRREQKT